LLPIYLSDASKLFDCSIDLVGSAIMLGVLILSAIISSFFFRDKRPRDRATFTVGSAIIAQFIFSLAFNVILESSLSKRGYDVTFEFGEFFVRWLLGGPIVGLIVWAGLWWWYQRNWIDDEDEVEIFQ
jgi:hypothetical protein